MPVSVNFSKSKAEHFLDCLANGKPIEGVRTVNDFLALAGACRFAALSHGPVRLSETEWSKIPAERREAISETFEADLDLAIGLYAQLTQMVKDGEYDAACEPEASAVVYSEDGKPTMVPSSGFKASGR